MDTFGSLPFLGSSTQDIFRTGLGALKDEILPRHPVEDIQAEYHTTISSTKSQTMRDVYGLAFPAKLQIEAQILGKFHRLPGIPSSRLGLESMTGSLDELEFENMVGTGESEVPPPDLHSQMEAKLKLGTKPCLRGMF